MRVLVVEDEEVLAEAVARGLRREGMAVDVALDGEDAVDKASVNDYDVVVPDRDLPRLHGDDVCHALVEDWQQVTSLTPRGKPWPLWLRSRPNAGFAPSTTSSRRRPVATAPSSSGWCGTWWRTPSATATKEALSSFTPRWSERRLG